MQAYTPGGESVPVETPRAMTVEEIEALPEEYRNAAQMAKDAGFDRDTCWIRDVAGYISAEHI